jgi:hypothetical protein
LHPKDRFEGVKPLISNMRFLNMGLRAQKSVDKIRVLAADNMKFPATCVRTPGNTRKIGNTSDLTQVPSYHSQHDSLQAPAPEGDRGYIFWNVDIYLSEGHIKTTSIASGPNIPVSSRAVSITPIAPCPIQFDYVCTHGESYRGWRPNIH